MPESTSTYYVSSPQLPMVLTFPDCSKSSVLAHMDDLLQGTTVLAEDPEGDAALEADGFVIKEATGDLRRRAHRGPMCELIDTEDPDPSYVLDWSRIACVAITNSDPDPAAFHWEPPIDQP